MTRRLWIDTKGQPVITTTPNGVRNATRWGWIPAVAVASEQAEVIDRMGPAAGCAYCVGAGGYEDYDGEWRECSCQRADREPSDAEIEAAAAAMWDRWGHPGMFPHAPAHRQNSFRNDARAALIAAQEARQRND